jgi:integrase
LVSLARALQLEPFGVELHEGRAETARQTVNQLVASLTDVDEYTIRDALLMCLLLDHGLRASELALLKASDIDLKTGEMRFYRPKVKGTDHEWTTHKLTAETRQVSTYYLESLYPPLLLEEGPLILATTRLLKNDAGGQLLGEGLNRVRISERAAWLGKQLGIPKLSAHDCRHYCATRMARLGYSLDELRAWFGWTSAQTAMRDVTAVDVKERYKG